MCETFVGGYASLTNRVPLQLYLASQDKHNVFHLILRLELLPEWTTMVAARIGSPGGPISEEFEATQEELDW